jgi:hypothetical protein
MATTAEPSPETINYFGMEDEELNEQNIHILSVLFSCTTRMINEFNRRDLDATEYQSFRDRLRAILVQKGVDVHP